MRHRIKKTKFKYGRDANKMLMRKLAINFLTKGYLKTTASKIKMLKPYLEKIVFKMKTKTEANKNYLLRYLGDMRIVENGFRVIGPAMSKIKGGYIKVVKIGLRSSDGSLMSKIQWSQPVVMDNEKSDVKNKNASTNVIIKAEKG